MSEKPLIFNEQEQLQLQQLQTQGADYSAWGHAISRSLHSGQDSLLVSGLLQFLNSLISQANKQVEQLTVNAKQRIAQEELNKQTPSVTTDDKKEA